jgi:hypothetical protein
MQSDLIDRVQELRAADYTPKEIAAALGIDKATATRLVRAAAAHRDLAPEPGCWISPGWSHGLRIDERPGWPAEEGGHAASPGAGVAVVLLGVPEPHSRVSTCSFLVDPWCLGVKNTIARRSMSTRRFAAHRAEIFAPWQCGGIQVPIDLARHLVLGAVDYARQLGFEPDPDFDAVAPVLGQLDGRCGIEFGRDGKPFYTNGPHDDAQAVLRTLERAVGPDGFHFSVEIPEFTDHEYTYSSTMTNLRDAA